MWEEDNLLSTKLRGGAWTMDGVVEVRVAELWLQNSVQG